jgi:hypothetical protein
MQENPVSWDAKALYDSIDFDEAAGNSEMIDDGRIIAFRYLQLLPRT